MLLESLRNAAAGNPLPQRPSQPQSRKELSPRTKELFLSETWSTKKLFLSEICKGGFF